MDVNSVIAQLRVQMVRSVETQLSITLSIRMAWPTLSHQSAGSVLFRTLVRWWPIPVRGLLLLLVGVLSLDDPGKDGYHH